MNALMRLLFVSTWMAAASTATAQNCPCPPTLSPGWHGSAGAGVAFTAGNSDAESYNVNLALVYDPQKRDVIKLDGFYLKASTDGVDTAEKAALGLREEHRMRGGFVFFEARSERDRFKQLQYLVSPSAGIGYKILDRPRATLSLDAGFGFALEKLEAKEATGSGALRATQSLLLKLNNTVQVTEQARALWKTEDFEDAFYHFEMGLANSLGQRLELKLNMLVDVKNKPALPTLEKTDKALLASLVFKL